MDNPLRIMRQILAHGFQYLQLTGLPAGLEAIAQRNQFGAHVPVEEDVDFMLQHYEDIESVFSAGSHRDLYLFLGDGVLELNTSIVFDEARIEVISRPGLSRHFMTTEILSVPRHNFLMAWRRVARNIISAVHPVTAA